MRNILIASAALLFLGACAELADFREKAQTTVKDATGTLVDQYCNAVPGSATQQTIRDRLHLYLDERIITEIDCGEPT
jgi:hypothetical protein